MRDLPPAEYAHVYTQQDQGCTETELLCGETVTEMENSSKNEHYPTRTAEQRNRFEKEEVIMTEVSKLFLSGFLLFF